MDLEFKEMNNIKDNICTYIRRPLLTKDPLWDRDIPPLNIQSVYFFIEANIYE